MTSQDKIKLFYSVTILLVIAYVSAWTICFVGWYAMFYTDIPYWIGSIFFIKGALLGLLTVYETQKILVSLKNH